MFRGNVGGVRIRFLTVRNSLLERGVRQASIFAKGAPAYSLHLPGLLPRAAAAGRRRHKRLQMVRTWVETRCPESRQV